MPKQPTNKTVKKTTKASTVKKTAAKKAVTKKVAAKKVATKKVAAPTAATKKVAPRKRAASKATPAKGPITTTVIAKFDAGFGNELYIRGNSSGLNWDAGVLMENVEADEWVWKSTAVSSELEFKVLLNDTVWSGGPNGVVFPGATVVFEPSF